MKTLKEELQEIIESVNTEHVQAIFNGCCKFEHREGRYIFMRGLCELELVSLNGEPNETQTFVPPIVEDDFIERLKTTTELN